MSNDSHDAPGVEGSGIWRTDEKPQGEVAPPASTALPHSLWREDEGETARAPFAGRSDAALWREPSTTVEKAPPPSNGHAGRDDRAARSAGKPARGARSRAVARRATRILALVVGLGLCALVADGIYSSLRLRDALVDAEGHLDDGRVDLGEGALGRARASFSRAREDTEVARDMLSRPALVLARELPLIGGDIETVDEISRVASDVASVGLDGVGLARRLGVTEDGFAASIYRDGSVDLAQVESVQPKMEEIADTLTEAEAILLDSPRPVVESLREALGETRTRLSSAAESARNGSALFDALPELLGGEGRRRYLLAFQATGEARGTGGVIGLFGVLSAEDGSLELGRIGSYSAALPQQFADDVEAPDWFEKSYGPQYALRQWPQANSSPNFPVVSEVLLQMFEDGTGERLDGVLGMDPTALRLMMRGTGPLELTASEAIDEDEVEDLLLRESYVRFENDEAQTLFLSRLVESFWSKVKDGDFDPAGFASGFGDAVQGRHLSVYSRSPSSQEVMAEVGAAGEYAPAGEKNVQMFFHNNYAVNKVDVFLERSISTHVKLTMDGQAMVTSEFVLKNEAPSGPPSLLLGPGIQGDEPGLNRMMFNILAPRGAIFEDLWIDGEKVSIFDYRDGNFPVAWDVLEIPAGESATVTVSYRVVNAIAVSDGIPRFQFRLVPHALPIPERFSITIEPPSGLALAETHPDDPGVTRFTDEGVLDSSRFFDLVVVDQRD